MTLGSALADHCGLCTSGIQTVNRPPSCLYGRYSTTDSTDILIRGHNPPYIRATIPFFLCCLRRFYATFISMLASADRAASSVVMISRPRSVST
jgi:hypothetical protein